MKGKVVNRFEYRGIKSTRIWGTAFCMHLAILAMMAIFRLLLSESKRTYLVAWSNCQRTNIHDICTLNLRGIVKFVGGNLGTYRSHYLSALITENEGRMELLVDTRLWMSISNVNLEICFPP